MPRRRRYISTDISLDPLVNKLARVGGDFAVLLYTWMIPHAEDDATLEGDPEKVLLEVCPGRRDKESEDVAAALAAMDELGLVEWDGERVTFPIDSFYKYQTYIASDRRRCDQGKRPSMPQNAAKRRKTPQVARNGASLSPSLSHSSSSSGSKAVRDRKSRSEDSQPTPERVVELWNESTSGSLPRVVELSKQRKSHVRARIRKDRDEPWWSQYFARIAASSFCRGDGPRGWKANFDWAVGSEDTVAKVVEGNYDDPPQGSVRKRPRAPALAGSDAFDQLVEEHRNGHTRLATDQAQAGRALPELPSGG